MLGCFEAPKIFVPPNFRAFAQQPRPYIVGLLTIEQISSAIAREKAQECNRQLSLCQNVEVMIWLAFTTNRFDRTPASIIW
jgi:hypothetical protein